MDRYLAEFIKKDLDKKIVMLTGPRQVGKTWLSQELFEKSKTAYLNFDRSTDRDLIRKEAWDRNQELVVFDELHKMKGWKNWIKGIYDTEGVKPRLLVTGSARFDLFRRGGRESLAGRHFLYRLHPFSVSELKISASPQEAMSRLLKRGGFPEPYLAEHDLDADRWRLSHIDRMLREDLRDVAAIQDLKSMEYLVSRLAMQVGSPVSYQSLAEDVGVSPPTIKRWIQLLEAMYIIFSVYPWTRKIKGSILKQAKIYFYDIGRIPPEMESARFENLVACSLLKHVNFLEDTQGQKGELYYLRDKKKREVDFLLTQGNKPRLMLECKLKHEERPNFSVFDTIQTPEKSLLLSRDALRNESYESWDVCQAAQWLASLSA